MNSIVKKVKSDIKDETMANKGYKKLAKVVKKRVGKAESKAILHIAGEEAQHKRMLKKILKKASKKKVKK